MKLCVDNYGNSLVKVGDEVENEFARFFAASTGSGNNGDNTLVHMDATKPFTLKNPSYAMATCIRQGKYSVKPEKLFFPASDAPQVSELYLQQVSTEMLVAEIRSAVARALRDKMQFATVVGTLQFIISEVIEDAKQA